MVYPLCVGLTFQSFHHRYYALLTLCFSSLRLLPSNRLLSPLVDFCLLRVLPGGVEGGNHGLYFRHDIRVVIVACLREVFQLLQELRHGELHGLADENLLVLGLRQTLLAHELLLVELLAGAQSSVFDLDTDVWGESRELDEITRKRVKIVLKISIAKLL